MPRHYYLVTTHLGTQRIVLAESPQQALCVFTTYEVKEKGKDAERAVHARLARPSETQWLETLRWKFLTEAEKGYGKRA